MHFVEEVPNSTSAKTPGWAYVADTGFDPTKTKLQPANRKRTARVAGLAVGADLTARQQAALAKRIAELEKDNFKDVVIPIPSRQKEGGGRVTKGKTAATRKIIIAQKTFANYLADEEALAAQEAQNAPGPRSKFYGGLQRQASSKAQEVSAVDAEENKKDTAPTTAMAHSKGTGPSHLQTDDRHLLKVNVPAAPSEALMDALCTSTPLSYSAAQVAPSSSGPPQRYFCELCGYWGTIKCILCGSRVCGLECKRTHDEERCQKYPG